MSIKKISRIYMITLLAWSVVSAIVGVSLYGFDFLIQPLHGIPETVERYALSIMLMISMVLLVVIVQNLRLLTERWHWSMVLNSEGVALVAAGAIWSLAVRAFGDSPTITIGTPLTFSGFIYLLCGMINFQERLSDEPDRQRSKRPDEDD